MLHHIATVMFSWQDAGGYEERHEWKGILAYRAKETLRSAFFPQIHVVDVVYLYGHKFSLTYVQDLAENLFNRRW